MAIFLQFYGKQHPKYITIDIFSHKNHLETSFDGLHGAWTVAGHTLEEEQPCFLVQDCIRGSREN